MKTLKMELNVLDGNDVIVNKELGPLFLPPPGALEKDFSVDIKKAATLPILEGYIDNMITSELVKEIIEELINRKFI